MEVGSINNGPVTIEYEKIAEQKKPKTKLKQNDAKKTQDNKIGDEYS